MNNLSKLLNPFLESIKLKNVIPEKDLKIVLPDNQLPSADLLIYQCPANTGLIDFYKFHPWANNSGVDAIYKNGFYKLTKNEEVVILFIVTEKIPDIDKFISTYFKEETISTLTDFDYLISYLVSYFKPHTQVPPPQFNVNQGYGGPGMHFGMGSPFNSPNPPGHPFGPMYGFQSGQQFGPGVYPGNNAFGSSLFKESEARELQMKMMINSFYGQDQEFAQRLITLIVDHENNLRTIISKFASGEMAKEKGNQNVGYRNNTNLS